MSGTWYPTPLIPALGRQRQEDLLWVEGLHSEFQGLIEKPSLNKQTNKCCLNCSLESKKKLLKEFWFGIGTEPPIIPEIFLTSLLLFCTTYLYQATFSALVIIKLKHWSALKNTDYFLCPEASNTQARLNFFPPGWSGTYYIDEDDFELLTLLPSARITGMHHHA